MISTSVMLAISALLPAGSRGAGAQTVDFSREVRPILAQHCFKCHGPDDQQRMAGLRLDSAAAAYRTLGNGMRAVVPGKPEKSALVARIRSTGPDLMPPAYANKPLSDREKKILERWIALGAVYKPHWAFVPPKQAALPAVKQTSWPRNPIDRFVLARLEKEGLKPSPEADRYTLIRRASLDLTGLPPTVEETDAFVNDRRPDAYERLVDRLLASPHYGERWAQRWLDLARYADTNGYEKDRVRSIWPYRDWVINAFNGDMPFDQFTIAQLAGDMLPNATQEQRIATGFHRNTMLNEEGGIDPQEYRFYAMVDRTATTGTAWLGLTLGCAQCHTHKYDPITQKEYYRMMAFMNNADEPEMEVIQPDIAAQRKPMEAKIVRMERDLPSRFPIGSQGQGFEAAFDAWRKASEKSAVRWTVLRPIKAVSNAPRLTILGDDSVLSSGDITKRDLYTLDFKTDLSGITAIRLEALPDPSLPRHGPGRIFYEGTPGDFFLSEISLETGGALLPFAHATQSDGDAAKAIDGNPQTGWSINDGQGQTHTAIFALAHPLSKQAFTLRLLFEQYYAADLGRFRIAVTTDPRAPNAGLAPDVEAILLAPESERTAVQQQRLREYFAATTPELKVARDEIRHLREQMPAYPTTLVFAERPPNNPRPTYVHHRGQYLQTEQAVTPGVLAFLPPLPPGQPANRLTFARWLVDGRNPLVGRVAVNRQWAAFFGRGIVPTTEDFGYQGQPPSHPELLDWLAVELVRQGWSMKKLNRLIVTSATYRQSAVTTQDDDPKRKARDPQNRLLSRGPRVRLEAELVRDAALAASGLLSPKIGGPGVFPPQPPGVTSEGTFGALQWNVSPGEDRYRRGLYTFRKRTAPYAMFATFDAPSGEACLARREVSNTPLQALALLNDTVFMDAAQALGRMLTAQKGSLEERVTLLFRRCVTRPPTGEERALLIRFYTAQRQRFANRELDAMTVAGPGTGDAVERAAWTTLARSLLNLDEAITRQ